MMKRIFTVSVIAMLMVLLMGGLAYAEKQEQGMPEIPDPAQLTESLDSTVFDEFLETITAYIEQFKDYLAQMQQTLEDLVSGEKEQEPNGVPVTTPVEEPSPAEMPEEEAAEEEPLLPIEEDVAKPAGGLLWLLLAAVVLFLALLLLVLLNRKHVRFVDGDTGEYIAKQKIRISPKTSIDLTEVFAQATGDAVRVQFLKPVRRKLIGSRVVFLANGQVLAEIANYTGELEYTVRISASGSKEALDEETELPEEDDSPK